MSWLSRGEFFMTTHAQIDSFLAQKKLAAGIEYVWLQQGAGSATAASYCREQGIICIENECILMFAEPTRWPHR